jgi:DNA/RNA-binding domain of Phe-tRNA-synthetase-like protein
MDFGSLTVAAEFAGAARLGIIHMTGVRVTEAPAELRSMLNDLAAELAATYKESPLGEIETVRKIRSIFHRTGLDPTRHRPSSESLLRRAVKGKGLYFINSVVDLINYYSLRMLWPMGLYDASRLQPPLEWRIGRAGESYEGIGRDTLNLQRFPLLSDAVGPFGSPISDSMRTRVTEDCRQLLWITFAPPGTDIPLDDYVHTMQRFNSGEAELTRQFDA